MQVSTTSSRLCRWRKSLAQIPKPCVAGSNPAEGTSKTQARGPFLDSKGLQPVFRVLGGLFFCLADLPPEPWTSPYGRCLEFESVYNDRTISAMAPTQSSSPPKSRPWRATTTSCSGITTMNCPLFPRAAK